MLLTYLTAMGFSGAPTAPVTGNGAALVMVDINMKTVEVPESARHLP